MKKTLVAAGIIVALGVAWTGGAWYTGKMVESHLAEFVGQANAQLAQNSPESGLQLATQDYQRGIFSSHLRLIVKSADGAKSSWLKPGQNVVLDETVYHGPLPLKNFSLIPSMAVVNSTLVNNDLTRRLFELTKGKTPAEIATRIAYSGATNSDILFNPIAYENGDDKITFDGGKFELEADKDGNALALTGGADSGQLNVVNEFGQPVQFSFKNLKADGESKLTDFKERIGNQKLTLETLAVAVAGKELAVVDGMTIDGKADLSKDGKTIDSSLDYSLDSLKLQGNDMGSGKLALKINHIDGESWHQFSQQYNGQVQALLGQPEVMQDPALYQQKVTAAFFDALPLLLKGEPQVTVAPLSWKNAKGESTFNLDLALKDPSTAAAPPQTLAEEVDSGVKSLDGKLTIPMDMAIELMTQVARIEGYQQDDAHKLAEQQVKGLAAMGQMFRLTTVQDNSIQASLQYGAGQVTLNGQKMPLAQFVGLFGMPDILSPAPAVPQTSPAVPPLPLAPVQP
ncbi:YdgA family protein [uncultured Pluralibacter sp.]|uniref:YdgA family protein n=1 Tax=uncultured Pluralibacter sp. TaxID=1490864 RepID=UPI0026248A5D|nr:YdgA family protein [uncultured Pluralibacter sp.]